MKVHKYNMLLLFAVACSITLMLSCKGDSKEKEETPQANPVAKKDTVAQETKKAPESSRPPIINIMDTLAVKRTVLYMKDSAATFERVSLKLGEIYGVKLGAIIKKNNLKMTGQPMAWYNTSKPPYYFEAGIPVDKKPGKLPSNAFIREIGTDSVVVAHFYGRFEQMPLAYDALKDWLKGRKKTQKGKPYEVYVDDPVDKDGKMKDPYKVQTDVIFTWK